MGLESAIAIMGKANQSTHFTLLILPSSLRAVIFIYHILIHFGRCQAAELPPPEDCEEPG
jgi:hypothetical protein